MDSKIILKLTFVHRVVTGWVRIQLSLQSENNNNFMSGVQQNAATRGGQRGTLQFSVSFPYSQRIQ